MDRVQQLKAFLLLQPKDAFLQHALALEMIKFGDDISARSLFEGILDAQPNYVGSYYHLAKLLERLGVTNDAIAIYEKGMQVAKEIGDKHAFAELQAAHDDLIDE